MLLNLETLEGLYPARLQKAIDLEVCPDRALTLLCFVRNFQYSSRMRISEKCKLHVNGHMIGEVERGEELVGFKFIQPLVPSAFNFMSY